MKEQQDLDIFSKRFGSREERNFHVVIYSLLAILCFIILGRYLAAVKFSDDTSVRLHVKATVPVDDELQAFYTPAADTIETEPNSVTLPVKGKAGMQLFSFGLPDSIAIKRMRLDLGWNDKQGPVEIDHISLHYNGASLVLLDKNDTTLFTTNEYVREGPRNWFVSSRVLGKYDPFIYSGDILQSYNQLLQNENRIAYPYLIAFVLTLSALVYLLLNAIRIFTIRAFYALASCIFVSLLLSPSLASFTNKDKQNQEQRVLATRPEWGAETIKEYPKLFESYYNDNFGMRNFLVNLGSKIKYHVFGTSAIPHRAAVGKDGWLFLNGSDYWITKDLTRENLYGDYELMVTVQEWESRREILGGEGIRYYRGFWPDKHVIYSDFLPYDMKAISKDTISRPDQAVARLIEKKSPLLLLDVRPLLMEARKHEQIYYKYDSHWNARGAYLASNALFKALSKDFPGLKPIAEDEFIESTRQNCNGDISNMLGLGLCETSPLVQLSRDVGSTPLATNGYPAKTKIFYNPGSRTPLEALFFRDSFTEELIPYLNQQFRKVTLIWDTPFNYPLVRQVHPDLVVEAFASRYF